MVADCMEPQVSIKGRKALDFQLRVAECCAANIGTTGISDMVQVKVPKQGTWSGVSLLLEVMGGFEVHG